MAQKFDLNLNTPGGPSVTELQVQLEAFRQWAGVVEARQIHFQDALLNLVGSFDGLVGLLINREEVTQEAITAHREQFLMRIRQLQEQARAESEKPKIWTPGEPKIVPVG